MRRLGERGALLVGVVVVVTILLIGSAVAVQKWSTVIRRDREEELIFRGRQIAMACAQYRKDNGTFPSDWKQLTEMGGPGGGRYYLRRPYTDPMVPGGEWGLVYLSPQGTPVSDTGATPGDGTGAQGDEDNGEDDDFFGDEGGDGTTQHPPQTGQQPGMGQTGSPVALAGLPIIGVHSRSDETAMGSARWRNIEKYSEWLFTVEDLNGIPTLAPLLGALQPAAPGTPGQPGQPGRPGAGGGPGTPNPQGGGQ